VYVPILHAFCLICDAWNYVKVTSVIANSNERSGVEM